MIKVGTKKEKGSHYGYNDVHFDKDGWADATKFLPADFDLCHLKTTRTKEPVSGWHTGAVWDGRRLKETDTILYWKKNGDYHAG